MHRRHMLTLIAMLLLACLAAPARAAVAQTAKGSPRLEDVLTYIELFGYREMLELSVDHQLRNLLETVRDDREDIPQAKLDIILQELRRELKGATERSLRDMAAVFQRHLTQTDVDYLISVGRDPRMQKVVKLQPKLGEELEKVGSALAEDVYRRASPRIEERLRALGNRENI